MFDFDLEIISFSCSKYRDVHLKMKISQNINLFTNHNKYEIMKANDNFDQKYSVVFFSVFLIEQKRNYHSR